MMIERIAFEITPRIETETIEPDGPLALIGITLAAAYLTAFVANQFFDLPLGDAFFRIGDRVVHEDN